MIWLKRYYMLFGLVGTGLLVPLVRSFEDTYGLTHGQMGTLTGACSLLFAAAALTGGYIFDRYGPRWVLSFATAFQ